MTSIKICIIDTLHYINKLYKVNIKNLTFNKTVNSCLHSCSLLNLSIRKSRVNHTILSENDLLLHYISYLFHILCISNRVLITGNVSKDTLPLLMYCQLFPTLLCNHKNNIHNLTVVIIL